MDYTTERQIQRIEAGKSICSIDRIVELSQVLDISTDYLLLGDKNNNKVINNELYTYIHDMTPQEQMFALNIIKVIDGNKNLLVN